MNVEIYAETSIKSPRKQKGIFGYIIVCHIPGKEDATVSCFEKVEDMTPNQAELTALIKAMKRLNKKCDQAKVIQSNPYIKHSVTSNIENWKANGWMTARGQEIKNKELWQELDSLMKSHEITWIEDAGYQKWLIREIEGRVQNVLYT